jgi:GST-like protein
MIDLYTWTTPNGRKVSIMLEETGLAYKVIPVDLGKGDQFQAQFTKVNPNQKIPAIVDHDAPGGPRSVFESGAILFYLGEKTGRFFPAQEPQRTETMQWLMYQMSHVGPIIGQTGHFVNQAPEKIPYAIQRFVTESVRIVGVLDGALARREFLAGDYSIADIATYPWVQAAWGPFKSLQPDTVGKMTNVARWLDAVGARPAVKKGMAVP